MAASSQEANKTYYLRVFSQHEEGFRANNDEQM